jgi:hypothetical protein
MRKILITVWVILASMTYAQDAIHMKAESLRSVLGAEVGQERPAAGGGRGREFEKGAIYWSRATGARVVSGAVLAKYKRLGAEGGSLGYPVSDSRATTDGVQQTFEHGFVTSQAGGDARARLIPGVTFTENTVSTNDQPVLLDNPATTPTLLLLQPQKLPQANLSCGCTDDMVLGSCMITISNKGKTATCGGKGCSCVFRLLRERIN